MVLAAQASPASSSSVPDGGPQPLGRRGRIARLRRCCARRRPGPTPGARRPARRRDPRACRPGRRRRGSGRSSRGISSRSRPSAAGSVAPTTAPMPLSPRLARPAAGALSATRRRAARAAGRRRRRRSWTSAAPGLEVRTRAKTPAPASRGGGDQRLERVAAEQRVGGERRRRRGRATGPQGVSSRRPAPGRRPRRSPARRRACRRRPPAARRRGAAAQTSSSAPQPGAPRRSKQASCGLTATQAGPGRARSGARQCATTAAAATSPRMPATSRPSGPARRQPAGSGSRPRQTWLRRSSTSAASRSANGVGSSAALDLVLQRRSPRRNAAPCRRGS